MASVFPLKVAAKLNPEKTPTGWVVRGAGAGKGTLGRFPEGVVCRIAPGADAEVVQLGLGAATSRLCNAVYSKTLDKALVFEGEDLVLAPVVKGRMAAIAVSWVGPLVVTEYENYMKLHRGLRWFRPLDRESFPKPPGGWCSWYEYYLEIDEGEIVKNTDWVAEHLKEYGCEWVQIDDGWQDKGTGYALSRDWFKTAAKFPKGMKYLAEYIKGKGLRPGLWVMPFGQSDVELDKKHPGLFIKKPDGRSVAEREKVLAKPELKETDEGYEWMGRFWVDPSHADAEKYFVRLFKLICEEWGYDYVKIDGQGQFVERLAANRKYLADPSREAEGLYRQAVGQMKAVMGPQRFLLNCGCVWPSVGFCEGIRTAGDVDLRKGWEGVEPAVEGTMRWLWLNTYAFYTDPDGVCVREPLGLELARLWTVLVGITGQMTLASDVLYKLSEERVELLRRIFPVADIHPMEIYPLDNGKRPPVFDLKVNLPGVGVWDVVAVFNWGEKKQALELSAKKLGLEDEGVIVVDAGTGLVVHKGKGGWKVEQGGHAVKVLGVFKEEGRPQFVGTSRHVTMGGVDVDELKWEETKEGGVLSGASQVVGGDAYKVRVYVPEGWKVKTEGTGGIKVKEGVGVLELRQEKGGKVRWKVECVKDA